MIGLDELSERAQSDGAAAMALAERRLLGMGCTADQQAAYRAVVQAARLGHPDGRRAWIYLTAAGIGTAPDRPRAESMLRELAAEDRFAAVQHQFLAHLTCHQRVAAVEPEILSADPHIALYRGLFSAAECKYLIVLGTPWLEQAKVVDLEGRERLDPIRDAKASNIPNLTEDLVVQAINRCIAAASGTDVRWGEPISILRYAPGQQYRPHHDGYGSSSKAFRQLTALIWLNDDFAGGETDFPDLEVRVRGGVGDMLVFRNTDERGEIDIRMSHAGLPVTSGVKWMASRWIRASDFLG